MESTIFAPIVVNGFVLSFNYAVMAVGLSLIFGVLRVINFAHGEILMMGAYVVWVLVVGHNVPVPVAAIAATAFTAGVGIAIERGLFKPTRADPFRSFMLTIGVMYIDQVAALTIFGPLNKAVPTFITGNVEVLGTFINIDRVLLIPINASIIAAVWFFLERTKYGRAIRACIQDPEAAALQGISRDRMSLLVMTMGAGISGLAGAILSQRVSINAFFGANFVLKSFIVVIVGGMGSIGGTMIASLMFGFLDSSVTTLFNPRLIVLVDIVVLLAILAFRPRGFFGRD
jgi:branched-chain amino acid transport system permease protein